MYNKILRFSVTYTKKDVTIISDFNTNKILCLLVTGKQLFFLLLSITNIKQNITTSINENLWIHVLRL